MMLSGLVRKSGYKVVLTGEGADEVFAGYDIFKEAKIRRFWARQPQSKWRPSLFGRLYGYLRHSPVGNAQYASSFFGSAIGDLASPAYAHGSRWGTTRRLWNFFAPDFRETLQGRDVEATLFTGLPAGFQQWDGLSRDQYLEAQTLLSSYLLSSQGDRVAMANSIEGRVPFLDHELIQFANALPAKYKLRGLTEKAVLKAALSDALPADITRRTKQPYRAPDSASFFVDGRPLPYIADLLSPSALKNAGYFDPVRVQSLAEKCRLGRAIGFADNMAFVGIVSTMLVHEMFVAGRVRSFDTATAAPDGAGIESIQ
jgi:asparagine synthase (glutamine-hydrolysing)